MYAFCFNCVLPPVPTPGSRTPIPEPRRSRKRRWTGPDICCESFPDSCGFAYICIMASNKTEVQTGHIPEPLTINSKIVSLGSCFATEIGARLKEHCPDTVVNPFGVLYNPVSVANSIKMLGGMWPKPAFTREDVILRDTNPVYPRPQRKSAAETAAGTWHRQIAPEGGGFVSFFHHGSFARRTGDEFLENANAVLEKGKQGFSEADTVIITFGTSWAYRHIEKDMIVSNCHKHPAWEFRRELLDIDVIYGLWGSILSKFTDKQWIFTVSPIRHKKDGMHGNQISKAILLLSVERLVAEFANAHYFPAYEIVLDELRDYSFYKEDLVHPSDTAIGHVWNKFKKYGMISE